VVQHRSAFVFGLVLLGMACPGVADPVIDRPMAAPKLVRQANMEIVVRLRPETARVFQGSTGARDVAGAAKVEALLRRFGVDLKPQHPGVADSELASYFTISAVSSAQAEQIAAALRELDVVEAAYIQPPPSPA
jgi:hypothetical protein